MATSNMWAVNYDDYDVRSATVAVFDTKADALAYAERLNKEQRGSNYYLSNQVRNPRPRTILARRVDISWNGFGQLKVSTTTWDNAYGLGPCGVELSSRISRRKLVMLRQHDSASIEGYDQDAIDIMVADYVNRFRHSGAGELVHEGIHLFDGGGTMIYTPTGLAQHEGWVSLLE